MTRNPWAGIPFDTSDEQIAASDFILSILPPGDALGLAERLAPAGASIIAERRVGTRIAAERSMLAKFQSPLLLDRILKEPDFLEQPVRQNIAVMFLDLSGSTGVAEALGPERSRDLLSAMQTLVEGEVTAHGGVVITYMGDGVMAVFGLPIPRSDDAARALPVRRNAAARA